MDKSKTVTWEKVKIEINGQIKEADQVTVTVHENGSRSMSVDEYNRIIWALYEKEKAERKRKERNESKRFS